MEERRFDDLTRVLGAARSRRQVFKAALGGVAAVLLGRVVGPTVAEAAPAEVCNRAACKAQVFNQFEQCYSLCARFRGGRQNVYARAVCNANCAFASAYENRQCEHNSSGCFGGDQTCCNQQCTSLETDPNNCGSCGNACDPGVQCIEGHCACGDDQTMCDKQCVDTDTDRNHCGDCATQCALCEQCTGGMCVAIECGTDQVCCQNTCIAACPNGYLPDPTTCQCNPCLGDGTDGNSCGTNEICCGQQCVSNQCPQGKEYLISSCSCVCSAVTCQTGATQDPSTCRCVCDPITCPSGQVQDPDTCDCVASCENVTCDTCQTCDSSTGTCVPAADNSDCGGGKVCCNGTCQSDCTCTGLPCANGDCCANADDFACCEDGCCPQVMIPGSDNKGAVCMASGTQTMPGEDILVGGCCQPDKVMKLSVIDPTTKQCACDDSGVQFGTYCDGNMPTDYFGATPCSCGPWFPT